MADNKLQELFNSKPTNALSNVINKWSELPRLTVEQILEKSDLAQIDIKPSQLEFKTGVYDGIFYKSGFFVKGTKQLVIGRDEYNYPFGFGSRYQI